MKLLGWMHRKLRQNSTEPFKDLVTGQATSVDEENNYYYYLKPKFGSCKYVKQTQKEQFKLRKSFEAVGSGRAVDEEEDKEAWSGVFPGFLAIGTLGLETDPSPLTPSFSISVENIITEREAEVTEKELKVINNELEKVLVLTNNNDDSSGRNSHVSTAGRNSHGRISIESNSICPLQGYLFGSAVELSETKTSSISVSKNKEQQHHSQRTTLAELFQRSKQADQDNLVGAKDDTDKEKEEANKSAMHLMRKKLKKKRAHASSQTSVDSTSADRKLHNKILQMFHRKVHPENPTCAEKYEKKKIMNEGGHNKSNKVEEESIMIQPKRAVGKENIGQCKKRQLQITLGSGSEDSSENMEQWIKTDADCKHTLSVGALKGKGRTELGSLREHQINMKDMIFMGRLCIASNWFCFSLMCVNFKRRTLCFVSLVNYLRLLFKSVKSLSRYGFTRMNEEKEFL